MATSPQIEAEMAQNPTLNPANVPKVIVRMTKNVTGYVAGEIRGVHPEVAEALVKGSGSRPPCAVLVGDGRPKPRDRSRDQTDGRQDVAMENIRLTGKVDTLEIALAQAREENEKLRSAGKKS